MKKRILWIAVVALLFIGVAGAGYFFLLAPRLNEKNPVASADALFGWKFPVAATKFPSTGSGANGDLAFSDIRDPGGIPQGLPVRLQIPIIGVDSAIEDALITPDGRMDVPAGTIDVAWFALGPRPGQVGSAVIGGHYGIQNGVPFVFYDLNKLVVGEKIYIVNDEGNTLTFVVRATESFDRNADATPVFTSSDGLAHLNLITCEGAWNEINGNYPLRLVVFTDLVTGTNTAPSGTVSSSVATIGNRSTTTTIATFPRLLSIGAQGTEVVALQTFLEQRGLLELPANVVNGVFGPLTRAAIAEYQTSVGLPAVGIFGPLTRAKLISELGSPSGLPNAGIGSVSPTVSSPQTLLQSVEVLYATPLDAFVTFLLLILIAFMIFKIIMSTRSHAQN